MLNWRTQTTRRAREVIVSFELVFYLHIFTLTFNGQRTLILFSNLTIRKSLYRDTITLHRQRRGAFLFCTDALSERENR